MITLSNGVKLSETTVVDALKKAGISVEPPKHIFRAGDVARSSASAWRFIVKVNGKLYSINRYGNVESCSQEQFELARYKYVGRLADLV